MEDTMAQNQQHFPRRGERTPADLTVPVRNRYFYGKSMGVHQMEMEQEYSNAKRWLLNRLVTGPGVVCGLRVELTDDLKGVTVKPGLAIDRCGREIIVPNRSQRVELPDLPPYSEEQSEVGFQGRAGSQYYGPRDKRYYHCREPYAHVLLCYHECDTDPVPAMAGDCDTVSRCVSDSIREQYRVEVREGFAPVRPHTFPTNIVDDGLINYDSLVDYVMDGCRGFPDDCCIPLANIELRDVDKAWQPKEDNGIRPIVYTNRLLFQLINSLSRGDELDEPADV
jgi:hypothetical protein